MQVSLDGYIEGENGDMSWLQTNNDELWEDLFNTLTNVDLFILGRGMYTNYRNFWINALTDPKATPNQVRYARLADKTPHIVFSHTMKDPQWSNTTVLHGPVAEKVKELKQQGGKNIQIVGGARLAHTLLNAGLVDEYRLTLNPAIISGGKSFYHNLTNKFSLTLQGAKTTRDGAIVLRYTQK